MFYPEFQKIEELAEGGGYHTIPIGTEILSDMYTPIGVLQKLKQRGSYCYLLESAKDAQGWGRYSFLGFDPVMEVCCKDGHLIIRQQGEVKELRTECPGNIIRNIIGKYRGPEIEGFPPFTGGLVGYFSYDYIKYVEPSLGLEALDDACFMDVDLMLFEQVIVFDNLQQKLILIDNLHVTPDWRQEYGNVCARLEDLKHMIESDEKGEHIPLHLKSSFCPRFTKQEYCEMVKKAKQYIYDGDIFQVVLSNRLEAKIDGSILDVYRVLRATNPSPYMFYFSGREIEIAGASPETLVKLEKGVLHTFPLAGTQKRGQNPGEDERVEKELLKDEKELAEHNMLVDLGRNDLGKISKIGTVELEKYQTVERFSHVMHIGSTVRGIIREDKDFIDAVDAVLPAGTLSGAPKIRACEIIHELEGHKRGIYGGALGYIDFTGNMDICIAIRMAYAKDGKVYVCSGAGIVADSVSEKEYRECIHKAEAVVSAVKKAGEGMKP